MLRKMNVFDLIILAILAALTLRGIWKGMVSQIVSVATFFVCWIVASRFGSLVAPTIPLEAPWNQVAAMAIIFLITLVAVRFVHAVLEKIIKNWHLAKLNSLSGGILGFIKGLLLCIIITFFAVMVSETTRDMVFNAKTGPHLVRLIANIGILVPKDSYEFVHAQLAQFQEKVESAVPGQEPETLQVQSSEAIQRVLDQLQDADMPGQASSLVNAISRWWNGTQTETEETDLSAAVEHVVEHITELPRTLPPSPAASYSPLSAGSALPNSAEQLFTQRSAEPLNNEQQNAGPLETLAPLRPSLSSALETLTPLNAMMLPMDENLVPGPAIRRHVGSEQVLQNSTRLSNFGGAARVFQKR